MSQRKEKYLRRALKQYEGIVQDVDRSRIQSERALEIAAGQEERNTEERVAMERRLRGAMRRESRNRRRADRVARWALGVALLDLAAMVAVVAMLL